MYVIYKEDGYGVTIACRRVLVCVVPTACSAARLGKDVRWRLCVHVI